MLERTDGKYLLVQGFRGVRVRDPDSILKTLRNHFPTAQIQLLRSDRVAGQEHLSFAVRNALRAFRQDYQRSRTLAMEILVYASCERQISRAIAFLGLSARTGDVALVAVSSSKRSFRGLAETFQKLSGGSRDDDVLSIRTRTKLEDLKRVFRISKSELDACQTSEEPVEDAVKRLVIERSALLALEG